MNKNKYSFLLILISLIGCNKTVTRSSLNDTLKYENGYIYSVGSYLLSTKERDTFYQHQGHWQYNYPNGTLWLTCDFDSNGEYKEYKIYYINGGLKQQFNLHEDFQEFKSFERNGALNSIQRIKSRKEASESDDSKDFYNNGMLFKETVSNNEGIISTKIYDSLGKLAANLVYNNGREIKK